MEDTTNNKDLPDDRTMVLPDANTRPAGAPKKASLVVLAGWEIGREVELTGVEHVLGRSATADTRINSQSVSREHARMQPGPGVVDFHFGVGASGDLVEEW